MKFILITLIVLTLLVVLTSAYTPPDRASTNFTIDLNKVYTAPNRFSVNLSLVPPDTCTCAGLNNNWVIDMNDTCEIVDNCNLGTGTLSFTGLGWANINAIINTTDLGDPGENNTLYMLNDGIIYIS